MRDKVLSEPTTYTAELVFKIDNSSNEARSNINSLFSQSSILGSSINFSNHDLLDLIFTFKIISKALFERLELPDSQLDDYLINHFVDMYYYNGRNENNYYITDTIIDPYDLQNKLLKFCLQTNLQ